MFQLLTGWFSTPTAMLAASQTSGPAPLGITFDVFRSGSGITSPPNNGSGSPSPVAFNYSWHFGDDDTATWTHTGDPKNRDTGCQSAHVYETPGTYIVNLRVTRDNGSTETYRQTITVTDPDVVYAGATFHADFTLGNDTTGDGSIGNPWKTSDKLFDIVFASNGPRRGLLKRGETFTSTTTKSYTSALVGPFHIGPYGSGANPIISKSTANEIIVLGNGMTAGARFVDVDVSLGGTGSGFRPGSYCLYLRCDAASPDAGYTSSSSHLEKVGTIIQDCNISGQTDKGIYLNWVYQSAILGCSFSIPDAGSGTNHGLRIYPSHCSIKQNLFSGGSTSGSLMKVIGYVAADPDHTTDAVEYTVISDNIADGSHPTTLAEYFTFRPSNDAVAEEIVNCVWERNYLVSASTTPQSQRMMIGSARWSYFLNNRFNGSGDSGTDGIRLQRTGIEAVPQGCEILHNSFYSSGTMDPVNIAGTGADQCIDILVKNNYAMTASGTLVIALDQGSGTVDVGNTRATTGFTNPATNDWTPIAALYDTVTILLGALRDFDRVPRGDVGDTTEPGSSCNEVLNIEWDYLTEDNPPGESTPLSSLLGVNPGKLRFTNSPMFKDRMKQCGHTGTGALVPWLARDSVTFGTNATSVAAMTDATGYPDVDLPFDAGGGEGPAILETRMMVYDDGDYEAGIYYVYWDGTATLGVTGDATASLTATGQTFTVTTPSTTGIALRILTTSGTRVTNIRVVHEDHIGDYLTDPFHPDYLSQLGAIAKTGLPLLLRTFELSRTNGSRDGATNAPDIVLWSARTTTGWASQATSNGVAWEHIFQLINALDAYGWISVHHQADADYQTQLATLARSTLETPVNVVIQWSNEASFNGAFDQCTFTRTQGAAAGFTGTAAEQGNKYYCKVSAAFFDRWFTAWGDDSDRVHTALDTQASSVTVTTRLFEYYEETTIDSVSVNPNGTRVDLMSFAPYTGLHNTTGARFGEDLFDGDVPGVTLATATYGQGIAALKNFYMDFSIDNIEAQVAEIAIWSAEDSMPHTGVQPALYEFGMNITSDVAGDQSDATLTAYLTGLSVYQGMYDLVRDHLDEVEAALGTGPMCWFTFSGTPSGADLYGAKWSIFQDDVDAPKYLALIDYAAGVRRNFGSTRTVFRHPLVRWSIRRLH